MTTHLGHFVVAHAGHLGHDRLLHEEAAALLLDLLNDLPVRLDAPAKGLARSGAEEALGEGCRAGAVPQATNVIAAEVQEGRQIQRR